MAERNRKILIASPREPSGVTWLINCLLELGVQTYRKSLDSMWEEKQGETYLRPQEYELKKWIPSLHHRRAFRFKGDISAQWVHEWPTSRFRDEKIIYFYRDPRDSLYSRYRREAATIPFSEYLQILEPNVLLNKIECNWLHAQLWTQHPNSKLFRFEDYKRSPELTLRNILQYIGLQTSDSEIEAALAASTSDVAKEVEEHYNAQARLSWVQRQALQIVNQGGIVGRWRELSNEDKNSIRRIEAQCGQLMRDFGYEVADLEAPHCRLESYVDYLNEWKPFGKDLLYPSSNKALTTEMAFLSDRTTAFARYLTVDTLAGSGMSPRELKALLVSLAVHVTDRDPKAFKNVEELSDEFFGKPELYYRLLKRTKNLRWIAKIKPSFFLTKLFRRRPRNLRAAALE